MKTSENGIALVKEFEGFSGTVYDDVVGKPTIGYGHLIKKGENLLTVTADEAESLLAKDLEYFERVIETHVSPDLKQNQFDALVSFVFNVGEGKQGVKDGFLMLKSGNPSTMLKKLNAYDFEGAALEFPKWNKAGGNVVAGLTTRREKEKTLFLTA